MRKFIRYAILLFVLLVMALLLYKIIVKVGQKKEVGRNIATFSYTFNLIGKASYEFKNVSGKSSVIVFFNPGCSHCEYEGQIFKMNFRKIADSHFIMVSSSPRDSIIAYSRRHNLDRLPNFHFATDSLLEAHSRFGVQTIPTLFIYGKDGKLRKKYVGEVRIEAILRELN